MTRFMRPNLVKLVNKTEYKKKSRGDSLGISESNLRKRKKLSLEIDVRGY